MISLKEHDDKNQNNLFCYNSQYLQKLRKDLINNFNLDPKIIRNNESLKHFDTKFFNKFKYHPINENESFPEFDERYESIGNINDNKDLVLEKIKSYENTFKDDYLVNLNTIFHNVGIYSEIKENTNKKFLFKNKVLNDKTIFSKNFFKINSNCNIIIVEKFDNKNQSNINLINYFEIEKNSRVVHLIIQENGEKANLQFTNYVNCYEKSIYKQVIFNASESSIRNHNYANLLGTESRAELFGIFFAKSNQIIDNKTVVSHYAPHCTSDQKYKGVLTDQAKASYLSKTYVDEIAQKTEAYQLSKGILLSEDSYFHSKPELKIYADDVKCSHGSTIGPFDKNILFYCRSRGISENLATSLLINSFFSDIINSIDEKNFLISIKNSMSHWLNNNKY